MSSSSTRRGPLAALGIYLGLSAAALIRGLGVSARPTVVDRPRFRVADAVLVALVAGLVAYRFWGVWS